MILYEQGRCKSKIKDDNDGSLDLDQTAVTHIK